MRLADVHWTEDKFGNLHVAVQGNKIEYDLIDYIKREGKQHASFRARYVAFDERDVSVAFKTDNQLELACWLADKTPA